MTKRREWYGVELKDGSVHTFGTPKQATDFCEQHRGAVRPIDNPPWPGTPEFEAERAALARGRGPK